jgi:hypothetical protein
VVGTGHEQDGFRRADQCRALWERVDKGKFFGIGVCLLRNDGGIIGESGGFRVGLIGNKSGIA